MEHGVIMTHLSSMKNEMNHIQYYITARTKNKRIMLSRDAAEIMSEVLDKQIRVSEDAPAIISEMIVWSYLRNVQNIAAHILSAELKIWVKCLGG